MADLMKNATRKEAGFAFRCLREGFESRGMNYLKFLCLNWQSETGKRCTKKKHIAGEYGKELECEAQLTECLSFSFRFGGAFAGKSEEFIRSEINKLFVEAYGV